MYRFAVGVRNLSVTWKAFCVAHKQDLPSSQCNHLKSDNRLKSSRRSFASISAALCSQTAEWVSSNPTSHVTPSLLYPNTAVNSPLWLWNAIRISLICFKISHMKRIIPLLAYARVGTVEAKSLQGNEKHSTVAQTSLKY